MNYKQRRPQYLSSPEWREGGRNVVGFLIVFAIFFAVFVASIITAG